MKNALWGLFIGDALAMPAHWFYSLDNLKKAFGNGKGVTEYHDAPHPHPDSFMVGMGYEPDVEKAKSLGRPYDILQSGNKKFYETTYSKLEIERNEREGEHGNAAPSLENRFHYHHGMKAGENTLAAQLARVLMRSVVKKGFYDEKTFLEDFVSFMTEPGRNNDAYSEIYVRRWFENYSRGVDMRDCGAHQRDIWSIGSMGGMIRPLVLSLIAPNPFQATGVACTHQVLTHRSENVSSALAVTVPLLHNLIRKCDTKEVWTTTANFIHLPKISGEGLFEKYRDAEGPGNIPSKEMWKLHTELEDEPWQFSSYVLKESEKDVVRTKIANACYPEHGLPLGLFLAAKHRYNFRDALLANANAGGDNVHRGCMLGILLGAAQDDIPKDLKEGLLAFKELEIEIDAFVEVALKANVV